MDSPKPPPYRITLTLVPMLNSQTRHIIVCGAGESKTNVVTSVFATRNKSTLESPVAQLYQVTMVSPPPLPCAMVQPLESLTWIIDDDAMGNKDNKTDECLQFRRNNNNTHYSTKCCCQGQVVKLLYIIVCVQNKKKKGESLCPSPPCIIILSAASGKRIRTECLFIFL
jgi:Glucosamine-6-phosphate isomerases/6-phosphogluconolactonase